MELRIVNPEGATTHKITWLEINTPAGNFVIMPGHAPMIATLIGHKQLVFCLTNGKKEIIIPNRGIVEIHRTSATILLSE